MIIQSPGEMERALQAYASTFKNMPSHEIKINLGQTVNYAEEATTVWAREILHYAIAHVRGDITRLLVQSGATPRILVAGMINAWKWREKYHEYLKKFLFLKVVDIADKCNNWPLMIAATQKEYHGKHRYCRMSDVLYELLFHGVDPNARADESGETALMQLCKHKGCAACINLLIAKGAQIEAQDDAGKRAIVHAVEAGNLEAFRILMEHKACIGYMVGDQTLFDLAKKNPLNAEMVRRLRIAKEERP